MKRILVLALLLATGISLRAQVAEKLEQLGMENIRTATVDGNTTVAFENNIYRGTYRGIGKAIMATLEGTKEGSLQMVVLNNNIPQLCITLPERLISEYRSHQIGINEVYRQMGISYDTEAAMRTLKKVHKVINSSARKSRYRDLSRSETGKLEF